MFQNVTLHRSEGFGLQNSGKETFFQKMFSFLWNLLSFKGNYLQFGNPISIEISDLVYNPLLFASMEHNQFWQQNHTLVCGETFWLEMFSLKGNFSWTSSNSTGILIFTHQFSKCFPLRETICSEMFSLKGNICVFKCYLAYEWMNLSSKFRKRNIFV